MKKSILNSRFSMFLLLFLTVVSLKALAAETMIINIDVAPSVLNLQNQGEVVTVHTDIPYSLVVADQVSLNGIEINSWKADDRGNFVAKFLMSEVKNLPGLVIGGYNTLTLDGVTKDGLNFTGSQNIKVINVVPAGKK